MLEDIRSFVVSPARFALVIVSILALGFLMNEGTAEATDQNQSEFWGDVQCDGDVDPVDALMILRFDAGLPVTQDSPCPAFDKFVVVYWDNEENANNDVKRWADVNCSNAINPTDATAILNADAGLPYTESCAISNPIGTFALIHY